MKYVYRYTVCLDVHIKYDVASNVLIERYTRLSSVNLLPHTHAHKEAQTHTHSASTHTIGWSSIHGILLYCAHNHNRTTVTVSVLYSHRALSRTHHSGEQWPTTRLSIHILAGLQDM